MSIFPTKILLAVDGSEEAELAATMAADLAEGTGSELHLVTVRREYHPAYYDAPAPTYLYEKGLETLEREAKGILDERVRRIEEAGGKVAETHVGAGNRRDQAIVRLAEEIGAGLIVMGSRGLGALKRALMGSVSDSVVTHAHCPVLVVRGAGHGSADGRYLPAPIVLAVDGSEEAKTAAQAAAELSAGTGSEVHLIYVMPSEERLYGPHFYSRETRESLLERAKAEARKFLEERAEGVRSAGGTVTQTYLGTGRPDEEIVELAEEIGAGMVVMGSRGLGGVKRALMGSVSCSVVRHAHCPVMVVHEPKDAAQAGERIAAAGASRPGRKVFPVP